MFCLLVLKWLEKIPVSCRQRRVCDFNQHNAEDKINKTIFQKISFPIVIFDVCANIQYSLLQLFRLANFLQLISCLLFIYIDTSGGVGTQNPGFGYPQHHREMG